VVHFWKNILSFFQGLEGFRRKVPRVGNFSLFPASGFGKMGGRTP